MKKVILPILLGLALVMSASQAHAQVRWAKYGDFERLDTVVSIPRAEKNKLYISDDDFYLRIGFLGLELEVEDRWEWDYRDWRGSNASTIEYFEQHDHGTLRGLNFDIGLNNYLSDGDFPSSSDLYQLKPISSIYTGLTWNHTSYISSPLFIEWGGGFGWYNFKFENASTRLDPNGGQLNFTEANNINSALKSKLKVTYLTFQAIPMIDLGHGKRIVRRFMEDDVRVAFSERRGFRFGVGPYVGLRLNNKAKYIYRNDDGRQKDKEKGGFFVNDFRYGLRAQIGINGFDMFMTYDFNELFEEGKGPQLNPVTIGITF
ncbi:MULTISPECIES: hypothetical protein [unclassified Roseivirga]|uniref:hypothetical protein n=1 Tax=unclassified Roseivirga TaxID=2626142 RepID=UPI00257FAAD3|nr:MULTISPECIES: hypothetical protein [unclassified Roseivirga]MEC7753676.1 hypothetical protein [Bacteroidota bacterium]|tara:strand:+ start:7671 stop:8621 length:951 start_codon:yes stop_codon:yes gene_type:complete